MPRDLGKNIARERGKLMLFAIEIGFIDGEGVDKRLPLTVIINSEIKIGGGGCRTPSSHPFGNTSLDIIALVLSEDHAGPAVDQG
jgi:hypothetical protein